MGGNLNKSGSKKMENNNELNKQKNTQSLRIWCCDHCREVHFKAQNVMLNFTKDEFTELTHSVNEIFQQQFGSLEFYNLINLIAKDENILVSDTVS